MNHYQRARGIVDLVRGLSRADQAEVDINRVAVLCNIAAVHLATKEFGAAIELDPGCIKALARRCKAKIGRHEYAAAQEDIAELKNMGPQAVGLSFEIEGLLHQAQLADKKQDARTFGNMFDRQKQ